MKILNQTTATSQEPWSRIVTCGPIKGQPPIKGCGTRCEIALEDTFHKNVRTPEGIGRSFHWRCPNCFTVCSVPHTEMPTMENQTEAQFLSHWRENIMIEIARLHPSSQRPEIIENLALEFYLDDTVVSKVLDKPELYS